MQTLPLHGSDSPQRIELEFDWEFYPDRSGRMQLQDLPSISAWRPAQAGLSWNVQFEDLRNYMGAAWYRKRFSLPHFDDTRHVLLKFGAVDYFCELFVNGVPIGSHEGGYTPFSFEITSAIHPGTNELCVRVIDPPMDEVENRALFPEMMYNEIPHGKQTWYVQNSGIWQGVRIELCPALYIERVDVTPKKGGSFEIEARLAGIGLTADRSVIATGTTFHVEIFDQSGRRVFKDSRPLDNGMLVQVYGVLSHVQLWNPDNPALYVLEAYLSGATQCRRRTRFGFRNFESRDGRLFLNDKPFYMIGALDQDFYPETVHTPTSERLVREMMVKAKKLGFNLLRCHLKVAHPVYLDVADEVGMLIWTELPSWSDSWFSSNHFSTMAAVRAEKMFWEILIRDWNHPCIVVQTIMNESWGIDLSDASQRLWLKEIFARLKKMLAPLGRLLVDNSPCEGNFHIHSDLDDFHQYYSMPDQKQEWDSWLREFSERPAWTFTSYGDSERTGGEPLILSEFGNWGLPQLPPTLPWWFNLSFGNREITRPGGVLERFEAFNFGSLFKDFQDFAEQTQWHQFACLKYEIESLRLHSSIQGYVITGITDVHWEANGVLDMWRNEKNFASALHFVQQPDVIICKLPKHSFKGGEQVTIPVFVSHFSSQNIDAPTLTWTMDSGASGRIPLPADFPIGSLIEVMPITVHLPEVEDATREGLRIEMHSSSGYRVAFNVYELFILPPAANGARIGVVLQPSSGLNKKMRNDLQLQGFTVGDQGNVLVGDHYDESIEKWLRQGRNAILILSDEHSLPEAWHISVKSRKGTDLDGRWFSNFNWLRRYQASFSDISLNRILGFESVNIAPDFVLQDIPAEHFEDVLSGITYGWLNKNCGLLVQAQVGGGTLLLTTLDFEMYGQDVYATSFLETLLSYCSRPDTPHLSLPLIYE